LPRLIWDRPDNPTSYVSDQLGIERWQLRKAIHKIRAAADIKANEQIMIYDDGMVTDAEGEPIGNIRDEI
jgi:hypothetical protein